MPCGSPAPQTPRCHPCLYITPAASTNLPEPVLFKNLSFSGHQVPLWLSRSLCSLQLHDSFQILPNSSQAIFFQIILPARVESRTAKNTDHEEPHKCSERTLCAGLAWSENITSSSEALHPLPHTLKSLLMINNYPTQAIVSRSSLSPASPPKVYDSYDFSKSALPICSTQVPNQAASRSCLLGPLQRL